MTKRHINIHSSFEPKKMEINRPKWAARRGTMPNPSSTMITSNSTSSATTPSGKNSLTFESVVCSQLELQRRAASFSRRRSTMCRRPSQYLPPISSTSTSLLTEQPKQYLQMKFSNASQQSRTPSTTSLTATNERQSLVSNLYWDGTTRTVANKKDVTRGSRWSLDFQKETPHYGGLRSRLIEEYTDCESLVEFGKKTILVLMKTKVATIFLGILLILPIIMMSIGVSHLSDCPRQPHLPIYLFVAGIVWTTKLLQNIWHKYRLEQKFLNDEEPSSNHNDGHAFIDGLMTSFLVIWFFLGHYWLFSIGYPPHFEQPLEAPDIWCHKSVVLGSLASILITYCLLVIFITLVCFLVFYTRYTIIRRASTT